MDVWQADPLFSPCRANCAAIPLEPQILWTAANTKNEIKQAATVIVVHAISRLDYRPNDRYSPGLHGAFGCRIAA